MRFEIGPLVILSYHCFVLHVLDRYREFTDIDALKEFSIKPLRESIRVNALKMTVAEFLEKARARDWTVSPVPWCPEGFFIDDARGETVGRDLLHRTGHFYMQEAASMLPVALLDPKPGETVLDLCAAPGSKTTQIASMMQGKGVIIANDVQEKRLWVLRSSLQRMGVTNVIITKRVGQGFARLVEQFDRVLCDAPCTALGTSRKDSDALLKMHDSGVKKLSAIQFQLLETAIHAAKVGGRIVYSTCTLTWEENEQLVLEILNKFGDQVSVFDAGINSNLSLAIDDSKLLQEKTGITKQPQPFVRLWPHRYDTEGFFCAVLEKRAPTKPMVPLDRVPFLQTPLSIQEQRKIRSELEDDFGAPILREDEELFIAKDQISALTSEAASFLLPFQNYALGLPFGRIRDGHIRLSHETVLLRGLEAKKNIHAVTKEELDALFRGQLVPCLASMRGDVVLAFDGMALGIGMAKDGSVRHRFPKYFL